MHQRIENPLGNHCPVTRSTSEFRGTLKKTTIQRGLFAIFLLACFAALPLHAQDRFEIILAEIKEIRVE